MNIKRITALSGVIIAIALITSAMFYLINTIPPDGFTEDAQVIAIFDSAFCVGCHQKNNNRQFNSTVCFEHIKKGEAIDEVSLLKIEEVTVFSSSMPPVGYYLTHWGASITPAKQTILSSWIKSHREKYYPNTLAAKKYQSEPVRPVPSPPDTDPQKIALGKSLFYDNRLSADQTVSCASCHHPDKGGANNNQFAAGAGKRLGNYNTPTLFNAQFNIAQSWDGHASSMQDIIREHITNSEIMGNKSFDEVISRLSDDKNYRQAAGYKLTEDAITDAIEAYTKSILTPDCSFDKYLKGEEHAISPKAIYGYEIFKSNKCVTCHAGVMLGGQSFETMGVYHDYFKDRGWEITPADLGKFNITGDENDRHRFKVPGLRNVALTKPYFHDGSRQSLPEAVRIMGKYQCNKKISDDDIHAIVAFLETLTAIPNL